MAFNHKIVDFVASKLFSLFSLLIISIVLNDLVVFVKLNKSKKICFHWIHPSRDADLQSYIQTANISSSSTKC